jgi:cytochrome oxidase assembly protein ShyY1
LLLLPQAEALELPSDTPLLQVLVSAEGVKGESPTTPGSVFPLPKLYTQVVHYSTMPLDHLNYAVGWGAMSASMAILAVRMLRKGK